MTPIISADGPGAAVYFLRDHRAKESGAEGCAAASGLVDRAWSAVDLAEVKKRNGRDTPPVQKVFQIWAT